MYMMYKCMYMWTCIHIHVHTWYMHTHIHTHICEHLCVYMSSPWCIHLYMHICVSVYASVCAHTPMFMMCIWTHMCIYACIDYMYVCVIYGWYIYVYICIGMCVSSLCIWCMYICICVYIYCCWIGLFTVMQSFIGLWSVWFAQTSLLSIQLSLIFICCRCYNFSHLLQSIY